MRLSRLALLVTAVVTTLLGPLPDPAGAADVRSVEAPPEILAAPEILAGDPAAWSDERLAAQLVNACVPMTDLDRAVALAEQGVGGITLLGGTAPPDLPDDLARIRGIAVRGVRPLLAADEEGGSVQRLDELIGDLPAAETMGAWDTGRIRALAEQHGERMRDLDVVVSFAPVADLAIPGAYMERLDRAFGGDPDTVTPAVLAWIDGLDAAGVIGVVKHWPGHGHAGDSHVAAAVVPPFDELEGADLVPFDAALEHGVAAVMVGHLSSEGLTEPGAPVSLSPRALSELRARAGEDTVIVTDSLTMGAVTSALDLSGEEAAVRALAAGADWALTCAVDTQPTLEAVANAIGDGTIDRDEAVEKVRRMLALKARTGDAGRAHACRAPLRASRAPSGRMSQLPDTERLAGATRYETAAAVARTAWPDGAATVYVATGTTYADALAAAPVAAREAAPVLLVAADHVPAPTSSALASMEPDRIVVVGGAEAVPASVLGELRRVAPVERVSGPDRAATAAALSTTTGASTGGTVWIAAQDRFADALAAGPPAAATGAPLLLSGHERLPAATKDALNRLAPSEVVVVGGQAAVCDGVVEEIAAVTGAAVRRVAGATRYATAALLARPAERAWLATGAAFPDAVAAGAAAASTGGAVVLVPAGGAAPEAAQGALAAVDPATVTVVGGPEAVADEVVDSLGGSN